MCRCQQDMVGSHSFSYLYCLLGTQHVFFQPREVFPRVQYAATSFGDYDVMGGGEYTLMECMNTVVSVVDRGIFLCSLFLSAVRDATMVVVVKLFVHTNAQKMIDHRWISAASMSVYNTVVSVVDRGICCVVHFYP